MVAKVLVVNESKINVSRISFELQSRYCSLQFSKSVEDSLRIVGSQSVDLVLMSLPKKKTKLFVDFFSMMRHLCGVIPVVGVAVPSEHIEISEFSDLDLDDIIYTDISKDTLLRKVKCLTKRKNVFDENLLSRMYIANVYKKKIVTLFWNDLSFLHENFLKDTEVMMLNTWPVVEDISDADLFIINIDNPLAVECCANLSLKRGNRYKPIVFAFDKSNKAKAVKAIDADIGCTDIISLDANPVITAYRLNSLVKYKKLYEEFSKKLKKSLYMSAIDSTTEVYNRSFFEDYLRDKGTKIKNAAILMIDIDKFKTVNDKFGHTFADSMLRYVSSMIKRYVRSSDIIARYGGDEFIIVMQNVTKPVATEIANRIQRKIENSPFKDVDCTVSIGVCCVEAEGRLTMQDAILIADKFMYIAKQSGGNAVKVCA